MNITITKEWYKGLFEIIENINSTGGETKVEWVQHLVGYVSALEELNPELKNNEKI